MICTKWRMYSPTNSQFWSADGKITLSASLDQKRVALTRHCFAHSRIQYAEPAGYGSGQQSGRVEGNAHHNRGRVYGRRRKDKFRINWKETYTFVGGVSKT